MSNLKCAVASSPPFCMYYRLVCVSVLTVVGFLSDKPEIYTLK